MNDKVAVQITIRGCDDETKFNFMVAADELEFLKRLCDETQKHSGYGCQPDMRISQPPEHRTHVGYWTDDDYDEDDA